MKYFVFIVFITSIFLSCKKNTDNTDPDKIEASFTFKTYCEQFTPNDSIQYLDTLIIFSNNSDTGKFITYKWDFGDNTVSTQFSPVHSYNKTGFYAVKLYTFFNNIPSDTISRTLRIIVGQKEFRSSFNTTKAVDIEETPDNGAIVITYGYSGAGALSYQLTRIDSLLKQNWKKDIGSGVRLSSIKKINEDEYILSGNFSTGNTDQFCLTKISGNGNLIWQKYIPGITGTNIYTIANAQGEFITIGTTTPPNPYTVVVKCNANGEEIWRKTFDGISTTTMIRYPDNIIETSMGYVFASLTGSTNQIVLTQLDFNGNILKQTFTASGNIGTIFKAGVIHNGNSFIVYPTNTQYIFMFNSSLGFVDSRKIAETGIQSGIAGNNLFYIAEGSHQYAYIRQLNSNGTEQWNATIYNVKQLSCRSQSSGATRYSKKITYTAKSELLTLSEGENDPNTVGWSAYVAKYSLDGYMK